MGGQHGHGCESRSSNASHYMSTSKRQFEIQICLIHSVRWITSSDDHCPKETSMLNFYMLDHERISVWQSVHFVLSDRQTETLRSICRRRHVGRLRFGICLLLYRLDLLMLRPPHIILLPLQHLEAPACMIILASSFNYVTLKVSIFVSSKAVAISTFSSSLAFFYSIMALFSSSL